MRRRLALVAGYTAGHVNTAIAVAERYRQHFPDSELIFIGSKDGIERHLVGHFGYKFHGIDARPIMRVGVLDRIGAIGAMVRGYHQSRRILRGADVHLVVGFGGYATPGALLAARSLGIPTAVHEANAVAGRANRFAGKFVDRVLLSMQAAQPAFPRDRTVVVGQPVRSAIATLADREHTPPNLAFRRAQILVTSGSLGASIVNMVGPRLASCLQHQGLALSILHQAGNAEIGNLERRYRDQGITAVVVSYIDDMTTAYARADFIISAAGATTLAELTYVGVPVLIVPLGTAADDHQSANARVFAKATGALLAGGPEWDLEGIAATISAILRDPDQWKAAAAAIRSQREPDVLARFVAELETLVRID